jgi:hypothetical protein
VPALEGPAAAAAGAVETVNDTVTSVAETATSVVNAAVDAASDAVGAVTDAAGGAVATVADIPPPGNPPANGGVAGSTLGGLLH